MKNPHIELNEALFEINKTAFETDDFFKECEAEIEKNLVIRNNFAGNIKYASPAKQIKMQVQLDDLDRKIESGKKSLREYLEICFEEDGQIELESPDQKKLDAAFAKARVAGERLYLVYKHTQPHLLDGFMQIITEKFLPEEVEEYRKNVARRETQELEEILASLSDDKITIRP